MYNHFNQGGEIFTDFSTRVEKMSNKRLRFLLLVSSGVRRGARVTLSKFHFNTAKLS